MMMKIKSIKQLKAEKERLKLHEVELEHKMRGNWTEVKESLRPANIAKDTMGSIFNSISSMTVNKEGIIKGAIALGIGILVKKITKKAGEKLKKVFKK